MLKQLNLSNTLIGAYLMFSVYLKFFIKSRRESQLFEQGKSETKKWPFISSKKSKEN